MKRIIGAALAAGVLFLSGCSDSSERAGETTTQETTTEAAQPEYAKVGDTIPVDCVGNECSGELKVEKAQLGGECEVPLVAEDVPEGMQLMQLKGILTATKEVKDNTGAEIGVSPELPVAWDSEEFKTTAEWAGFCDIPQQYEQWSTVPAKMGEKVRMYGSFLIPEDAKELGIANSKFDLSKVEAAKEETTAESTPQQTTEKQEQPVEESVAEQPSAAPAEPEEEPVVGYTEAPGQEAPHVMEKQIAYCGDPSIHETGTTFFTDGTSGWTENCAAQMM